MSGCDLEQYRDRLRSVVRYRLDPRVLGRLDESDVVQEVLAEASRQLTSWQQTAGTSTFACLYQLARTHIARIHRDHVTTQKRSVRFEEAEMGLGDASVFGLAKRLIHRGPTPSGAAVRNETREQVRAALTALKETDREVLVMRILEGIPARDVGQVLGISEAAVNMRQLRALERLRSKLSPRDGTTGN